MNIYKTPVVAYSQSMPFLINLLVEAHTCVVIFYPAFIYTYFLFYGHYS